MSAQRQIVSMSSISPMPSIPETKAIDLERGEVPATPCHPNGSTTVSTTVPTVPDSPHSLLTRRQELMLLLIAFVCAVVGGVMYLYGTDAHETRVYVHLLTPYAYCMCDICFLILLALVTIRALPKNMKLAFEKLEEQSVMPV